MSTGSCPWTATAQAPWIAVASGGAGTATLSYSVQPNAAGARQGIVEISAGGGTPVRLTVDQAPK